MKKVKVKRLLVIPNYIYQHLSEVMMNVNDFLFGLVVNVILVTKPLIKSHPSLPLPNSNFSWVRGGADGTQLQTP